MRVRQRGSTRAREHGRVFIAVVILLFSASTGFAQNALQEQCSFGDVFCARMGAAAEITQVRTGVGLSGGNPVPGASSTMGIRLGAVPRITIAARATGVQLDIPDVRGATQTGELSNFSRSFNIDAAVGIFSGLSLLPTVGGFGSIDVLASYGKLSLPDEYATESANSWGVGVRVGILRESFTAPGVSVSTMYRKIDDVQLGTLIGPADGPGTYFFVGDSRALSARATVGKRILMLGAVAGVGYDKYSSRAIIQDQSNFNLMTDDFDNSRTTLFANLSWTMLLLHIVGEGGVQRGGDENAYYGSLAVRLAL